MFGADAIRCMRRSNGGGGGGELDPDFVVVIDTTKGRSDLLTRFYFHQPSVVIDWGDGTSEPFQSASSIYCAHTYSEHGIYTIRVSGSINQVLNGGYLSAITDCLSIGSLTNDLTNFFYGASNLVSAPSVIPEGITRTTAMFRNCYQFNGDISNWDVSSVFNMERMFQSASSFNQDLSGWCVGNLASEPTFFALGSALSPENYPVWGTCP